MENAQKESRQLATQKIEVPQTTAAKVLRPIARRDFENEMIALYQSIESRLPDLDKKVILFLSAKEGEGTSTIVREFARIAARKMGKTVFVLDSGHDPHQRCIFLHIMPESEHEGTATGKNVPQGEMDLEMCPLDMSLGHRPLNFYSPNIADFWDSLRQKYDLILVDSSSVSSSPDGIEISRGVDGVILVVEAEKTRWQVVENLKQKIEKSGGNILGMVFNKRRYYIPESIYQRL
ncbi:CpsD/CapB family tyrosine-protein kinase [bacterium]|nr:MAG: CpsD/CapB family tyrosine-protein kinase [bacterium]